LCQKSIKLIQHDSINCAIAYPEKRPTGGNKQCPKSHFQQRKPHPNLQTNRGREDGCCRRVFLVNRDALILQTFDAFSEFNLECGIFAGEYDSYTNKQANIQIVSVQTLEKRGMDWFSPEVVFADEAHLTAYAQATNRFFSNHSNIIVGLTATPFRLASDEEMGDKFNVLVKGLMPWELIEMGILKNPIYYGFQERLKHNLRHLQSVQCIVDSWVELAQGRKTICFACDVEHAHAIALAFQQRGIKFVAIDGSMSPTKRQAIYDKLKSGEIIGLSSCDALSEGLNIRDISAVILARQTENQGKYHQQIGRGLRAFQGLSDCLILDFPGLSHHKKFGRIEDVLDISLSKSEQFVGGGSLPTKICPGCSAILPCFEKKCGHCGHKFSAEEMPLLSPEEKLIQRIPVKDRAKCLAFRHERRKAFHEGQLLPTSSVPPDWSKNAIFRGEGNMLQKAKFLQYLQGLALKEGRNQAWIKEEMGKEFS
jgi:hypothetical protein